MNEIDFLEHGGGHFHLRHNGDLIALPDPRAEHYQWVLVALALQHVPGTPLEIPEWQRALVFDRWRMAWDLPEFRTAQRLAYLVDNYRSAIAYDLRVFAGSDLGDLWRGRRWVHILDLLDHLPAHSWYSATVSLDEEHARMMADQIAAHTEKTGETPKPKGPALTTWTPEVAKLTEVLDAVNGVQYAVIAAQAGKKAGPPPKPAARPYTPLEAAIQQAENKRRKKAHEDLVARVLPHTTWS